MKLDDGQDSYILGNSDEEHARLIRQAKRLAPVTENFFREAGIGPGQRVLDLGSGGIIAFQEASFAPFLVLSKHLPLWSASVSLLREAAVRYGVNVEMGPALHKAFQDAGLPRPNMRLVMELGHDPEFIQLLSDAVMSGLCPHAEKLNLSLEELGDLSTLQRRLEDEVASSNTVVPWIALVGAWCRTPQIEPR